MSSEYMRNAFGDTDRPNRYQDNSDLYARDDQALLQEEDDMIGQQDQALGRIADTAKVLQHYGRQIGDEVDDQLDMMEDLEDGMHHTSKRLKRETQHVEYVRNKAAAGGMMCCIFLLIVAIVVVAIVPF
ncbi:hypothetical protein PTSG_04161 [Salpingoeca rosetta]|uniref:t-SNARE coiled-coil homology domain-containing protein n=1 Tax=Salpingoeca rosetta (strain ATCC 50818 / BSB-021) TaxID=946362 RepID=F2U6S4_SALR5|nr:uncharacterized protein PTSG_04161 [Salpingoeca rosetta]EGD83556.1 hypothetical protein PTSG_04161 [Salpingoeca rosetta]|eukprot:XP_004995060.1 hypothetical protein PTSG_04161 [Salpingoeca rosetta]